MLHNAPEFVDLFAQDENVFIYALNLMHVDECLDGRYKKVP